ncbi:MAG: 30S ribosomal protein S6 [Desulfobacterales bacterium]|nr:MAG: 30S ribosomal protein S6 [Desulfobacterales bacterium]
MRKYETVIIMDPDLAAEERAPVLERIKELIPQQNGLLVAVDEWGVRKMAYEIKKKLRGYYMRLDFCGTGELVNEMERFFRIDDRVLKFMTVLLDPKADLEKIREEIAKAEAEAQADTATPEAAKELPGETEQAAAAAAAAPADEAVEEVETTPNVNTEETP